MFAKIALSLLVLAVAVVQPGFGFQPIARIHLQQHKPISSTQRNGASKRHGSVMKGTARYSRMALEMEKPNGALQSSFVPSEPEPSLASNLAARERQNIALRSSMSSAFVPSDVQPQFPALPDPLDMEQIETAVRQVENVVASQKQVLSSALSNVVAPPRISYKPWMGLSTVVGLLLFVPTLALKIIPFTGLYLEVKMLANVLGGLAALVTLHTAELVTTKTGKRARLATLMEGVGDATATQIVLRSTSILTYSYFLHVISFTTCAAHFCGLAGITFASVVTGVVMGLVAAPLNSAWQIPSDKPLLHKLRTLARRGPFSREGLFGGVSRSMVVNVVGFTAFFVSYSVLALANSWFADTLIGTAVAGGVSGGCTVLSVAVVDGLSGLMKTKPGRARRWWKEKTVLKEMAEDTVGACKSGLAISRKGLVDSMVSCAVLFTTYKAVVDAFMRVI